MSKVFVSRGGGGGGGGRDESGRVEQLHGTDISSINIQPGNMKILLISYIFTRGEYELGKVHFILALYSCLKQMF